MKKKLAKIILIVFALSITISPSQMVFAVESIGDLAVVRLMLSAAETCKSEDNVYYMREYQRTGAGSGHVVVGSIDKVSNFLRLNYELKDGRVHSGYLDKNFSNDGSNDGADWANCDKYTGDNVPLRWLMKRYNIMTEEGVKNLICGADNKGGLFNIYTGFKRSLEYRADDWPPNFPLIDSNGKTTNCNGAYDAIIALVDSVKAGGQSPTDFYIKIERNKLFSARNFFSEYIGGNIDLESVKREAMYLNLVHGRQCKISFKSESDFDAAKGSGVTGYHKIFAEGEYKYILIGNKNGTVYINDSVGDGTGTTCENAAKRLEESSENIISYNRAIDIVMCWEDVFGDDGKRDLLDKRSKAIEQVFNIAEELLYQAELYRQHDYDPRIGDDDELKFMWQSYSERMSPFIRIAGEGKNLNALSELAKEFQALLQEYAKRGSQNLTKEDKENIDGEIAAYRSNLNVFKTDIVDKASASVSKIDKLKESAWQGYFPAYQTLAGSYFGDLPNSYEDLYSFDEDGQISCILSSRAKETDDEIAGIIDGSAIGFTDFKAQKKEITKETVTQVNSDPDLCMMNGDSLGWWLCPVIKKIGATLDTVYEEAVEPFLQVNPGLLAQSATRDVWTIVVGIANMAVVIFFLVIIFSQLTGVGLDNYNIKKMLPKIIVVAVLVNLSYLICQLAVDVSNIVGNGLDDMLRNAAPASVDLKIKLQYDELVNMNGITQSTNTGWFKTLVDAATFGIAIGGVVEFTKAVSGGTILSGLILPILLMLIVVLFAVIFFFLLMGIRQAGVVMLVILAPLAMVCYMLPNTKKYFDKWKKAFSSLLLLYPICGLIVGGGELASRLLIQVSGGSYLIIVVALALLVVPFFFIPTLLKGSLQAMGNIGAKVSGLGSKMGKGASSRVRNSEAYKRAQELGMEKKAIWRAGLKRNADGSYSAKKVGRLGRVVRGGKRSMSDARGQALAVRNKQQEVDSMMKEGFDARMVAQDKKFESEELASWMTLVNNETRNGEDEDALFALYQKFLESDNKSGAVAVARIAGRRKDTAQRFMGEKFNDLSKYSPKLAQSIAKEISTGENNRMYMESAPLQFEYAAQLNRARDLRYNTDTEQFEYTIKDKDGNDQTASMAAQFKTTREVVDPTNGTKRTEIVGGWANNQQNIHSAVDKYITDRSQLAGMKGSSLTELIQLMEAKDADGEPVMKPEDQAHLRKLATEHIENGLKGLEKIDYTKAEQYAKLSGGDYTYDPKTREFTKNSQDLTRIDLDHSRDRVYNNKDQGGEISEL